MKLAFGLGILFIIISSHFKTFLYNKYSSKNCFFKAYNFSKYELILFNINSCIWYPDDIYCPLYLSLILSTLVFDNILISSFITKYIDFKNPKTILFSYIFFDISFLFIKVLIGIRFVLLYLIPVIDWVCFKYWGLLNINWIVSPLIILSFSKSSIIFFSIFS